MSDKRDRQRKKGDEKKKFEVPPRQQIARREMSSGRQAPAVLSPVNPSQQWYNVQEDMPQSSRQQQSTSQNYYVPDTAGQPDQVPHIMSQYTATYMNVNPGQEVYMGGQPGGNNEWTSSYIPDRPMNLSRETWSTSDGTQDPSSTEATMPQFVAYQPGPNQPVYFYPQNGEEGYPGSGYQGPMQGNSSHDPILQPPTPTMAPPLLYPGPYQARGSQRMFPAMVPMGPNDVVFYRTRRLFPRIFHLVCPFCSQQVIFEVNSNETLLMSSTAPQMIWRQLLSRIVSTLDGDNCCTNCKSYLGNFIQEPYKWLR